MSATAGDSAPRVRPPRTPKCTRCRNHGILVPVRGHSGRCGWKLCNCPKCALVTERHKILSAQKLLRKPEEPAPKDGRGKARTPETTGAAVQSLWQAESTDLKRKKMSPSRISAFETVKRSAAAMLTGPPMYPPEYVPTLDYFERETTRMYFGCPPIYHYPAFPIGLPSPGFRSALMPPPVPSSTSSPVIPFRGSRPCYPQLQDGRGDFRPSYYHPVPQYMPPGYLPGLHYMPPTVPLSISFMAEPKKSLSGQALPDSQSLRIASERSETPARDKSA